MLGRRLCWHNRFAASFGCFCHAKWQLYGSVFSNCIDSHPYPCQYNGHNQHEQKLLAVKKILGFFRSRDARNIDRRLSSALEQENAYIPCCQPRDLFDAFWDEPVHILWSGSAHLVSQLLCLANRRHKSTADVHFTLHPCSVETRQHNLSRLRNLTGRGPTTGRNLNSQQCSSEKPNERKESKTLSHNSKRSTSPKLFRSPSVQACLSHKSHSSVVSVLKNVNS